MIFIITYDLVEPGQRYQELIDLIKKNPGWAKLCDSSFLVKSEMTAVQLRDSLKVVLDSNDKLFVGKVTAPAAWAGMSDEVSKWILEELK